MTLRDDIDQGAAAETPERPPETLAVAAQRGDREAFAVLVESFEAPLVGFLFARTGNREKPGRLYTLSELGLFFETPRASMRGAPVELCQGCGGMWLDAGELKTLTSDRYREVEADPPRYRELSWSEFRGRRTDGDYADYGAEVQISQYRL